MRAIAEMEQQDPSISSMGLKTEEDLNMKKLRQYYYERGDQVPSNVVLRILARITKGFKFCAP